MWEKNLQRLFWGCSFWFTQGHPKLSSLVPHAFRDQLGFVFSFIFVDFLAQQSGLGLQSVLRLFAVPYEDLHASVEDENESRIQRLDANGDRFQMDRRTGSVTSVESRLKYLQNHGEGIRDK
jgi:hypothetical protein